MIKNLENIDSIIFDFGGVIININYDLTIDALGKLAGFCIKDLYTQVKQIKLFDDFECGLILPNEFRNGLKDLLKMNCTDQEIDTAWNLMLLDIPKNRIELLEKLSDSKKIFLFSNTNEIHKIAFDNIFSQSFGHKYSALDNLFTKAYYSHLIKDRKPNKSAFQILIDEQKLDPKKTLFIDDTYGHIKGAEKVGLQTLYLKKGNDLNNIPAFQDILPSTN